MEGPMTKMKIVAGKKDPKKISGLHKADERFDAKGPEAIAKNIEESIINKFFDEFDACKNGEDEVPIQGSEPDVQALLDKVSGILLAELPAILMKYGVVGYYHNN
jgi:hypothetical protein